MSQPTYTVATLPVSAATWHEISQKLRQAQYDEAFYKDARGKEHINMQGIALEQEVTTSQPR